LNFAAAFSRVNSLLGENDRKAHLILVLVMLGHLEGGVTNGASDFDVLHFCQFGLQWRMVECVCALTEYLD